MFIEVFRYEDYYDFATLYMGCKSISIKGINYGDLVENTEDYFDKATKIHAKIYSYDGSYGKYEFSDFKVVPLNENARRDIESVREEWTGFMVDNFGEEYTQMYNEQKNRNLKSNDFNQ